MSKAAFSTYFVVEIKRGRLIRETIAQAIDYASNSEERESLA
jgi:hypothetical protein